MAFAVLARGVGDPDSPLHRQLSFVFQHLHFVGDSQVAEKCTEIIRSFLPNILQPFYTGKSLRMGAMSFLNWDPRVAYEEAVAQGVWSTPSNSDWYVWQYLIAIIPPALCLSGSADVRVLPKLPSCLLQSVFPYPYQSCLGLNK